MSYASDQGVLNAQWNAAEEASITERARRSPCVLYRPSLLPDGDKWCFLFGDDLVVGIAGFGDTPEQAAAAFDEAWRTTRPPMMRPTSPRGEQEG